MRPDPRLEHPIGLVRAGEAAAPLGHERHRRLHGRPAVEELEAVQARALDAAVEEVEEVARLLVERHLVAHLLHVVGELGDGLRYPVRAAHAADQRLLLQVAVLLLDRERPLVLVVGVHDAHRDRGVDPCDELGIERAVGHTVFARAVDAAVDALHALDHAGRRLRVAEGGAEHVAERVACAAQRILAVRRLRVDARHHRGMEHLHEDGARAGDHDAREVAVDLPRHAARPAAEAEIAGLAVVERALVVAAARLLDLLDHLLPEALEPSDLRIHGGSRHGGLLDLLYRLGV